MSKRAECGVPPGSAEIEIDGVRLAVAREGRGPSVVCLHAIAHGGRDFERFTALCKDRFDIIRVDWPGQGRSGDDHKPPSAARYAFLLQGLLDRLGVVAPIVIGCSIGGAAAICYAAERPVRGLVLCDPGGLVPVTLFVRRVCRTFARCFAAGERGAWWFGAAFSAYYRMVLPTAAAATQRRRIVAAAYETAGVLRAAWESFAAADADIRDLAQNLDMPVWFAWARRDRIVPLSLARPAIDRMRQASVMLFDAGHAAFLEQPEGFAAGFAAFAESLPTVLAPPAARRA